MSHLEPKILGTIHANELVIGKGVVVEEGVVISGKGGPASKVVLGDFSYIGTGTRIFAPEFEIGEYSKFHMHGFGHGEAPLRIGSCCWIGGHCVLDSQGGLDIDDNVGIGASSQLWTHIQFGDIVEGSRFNSRRYMHVGKDAWLVGHCIVSPVTIGARSMALVGSVVTKDMIENHIYAGVPAADITDKVGGQFETRTVEAKFETLTNLIKSFEQSHPEFVGEIIPVLDASENMPDKSNFNVSNRTYTKTMSRAEVAFLQKNVPLIKFLPEGQSGFVPRGPSYQ